jgi:hypothetical protein
MELERSWAAVMHKDHADFSDYCKDRKNGSETQLRPQRSKPLWHVREHMAFLIRNLQFYIQVITRYTTKYSVSGLWFRLSIDHIEIGIISLHMVLMHVIQNVGLDTGLKGGSLHPGGGIL